MRLTLTRLHKNGKKRLTAIEYGLIAAGISVAIIAVVQQLGKSDTNKSPAPATTYQAK